MSEACHYVGKGFLTQRLVNLFFFTKLNHQITILDIKRHTIFLADQSKSIINRKIHYKCLGKCHLTDRSNAFGYNSSFGYTHHLRSFQTRHNRVSYRSSDKIFAKFCGHQGPVCYICYIENSSIPSFVRFWFL